jgi:hypothetical protein
MDNQDLANHKFQEEANKEKKSNQGNNQMPILMTQL